VPVGWYDFDEATWIPAPNGRVIEILREDNGLAVLAVSGEGLDATPEDLEALGIDEVERQTLAELYEPGTSLWRVLVDHFSPWDCNWPYGPPDDAELPPDRGPKNPDEGSPDRDCEAQGCVIGVESQVLGEDVSIIGTPYSIHYRSDRVLGRKAKNVLKIPLSDSTLPASLKRIELTIQIAGRRVEHSFLPAPDLTYTWTWDGLDAFGRSVTGANTARVEIKYVYGAAYYSAPSDFDASFAHLGASSSATGGQLSIVGRRQALEVGIAKTWSKTLGAFSSDAAGLGAWSLSVHHAYDPVGRILYRGDGRRRSAISIGRVITTPAGNGDSDYLGDAPPYGDGGPAIDAVISPTDVELAPDGSLYIADSNSGRIRRVDLDGVITNVAGTYPGGDYGDGGPATDARLDRPHGIAFGPDGSLYIADTYNNRIRRVGPDGMISTVAGTGDLFYRGDGGPATQATLNFPRDVAVAPDGSLYIADDYNNRIRRVGTDGIISTVAGGGDARYGDDGGPAIGAYLVGPGGVAVAPDGSLYIAETFGHRIRRVRPDGIITTVAGTSYRGYFGDGGPAIEAGLNHPHGVAVGPDGSLYIADTLNQRIRRVGPDGIIYTLAGTGEFSYNGDERPATGAMLNYPSGVALDFDGNLYVADWFNLRVRRVGAALPGTDNADIFVPSEEGGELYHFDPSGRHLETLDTLTGAVLYSFGYNPGGLLVSITDVDGEVTRIEREPAGDPGAMFAPNGQRTDLTLDPNGYLATVSNPAGDTHRMVYSADGLLTSYADPREQTATYQYDDLGLLTRDDSPNGDGWLLSRTETDDGHSVTLTSKEGRAGTYTVETVGTDGQLRSHTAADGTVTRSIEQTDGVTLTTRPDGTLISSKEGPDPRFGMQSPVTEEYSLTTPGGLVYSTTESRGVELADERDPLSLTALTETITTNGRESTSRYDAASRTWTHTSPEGRVSTAVVDAKGRLSESRVAALEAQRSDRDPGARRSAGSPR